MYLRELLRLMLPRFHQHLLRLGEDGLQLLFCHRWILLCFKREFPDTEALRMWEACWAHYQVRAESTQIVRQRLSAQRGVLLQHRRWNGSVRRAESNTAIVRFRERLL